MEQTFRTEPWQVSTDTLALRNYGPLPGIGIVPINAFLIQAAQPVLVDTGIAEDRDAFMTALRSIIDPKDLRWVWLTHTHPDHVGNLVQVLEQAPDARLVTTYLGMGLMQLMQLPLDRVYLLNPGQVLDVGDRKLVAIKPPTYDASESTGFMDNKTRTLFCVDCFGAVLSEPAETAADVPPTDLRDGMVTWATIDSPWLALVEEQAFAQSLYEVRKLEPRTILSAHLSPAIDMTDTLLQHLAAARSAPPFVGPDQAALEQMMGSAPTG